MKRLQQKLLPICIMMICGSASVSSTFAADSHASKVQAKTASAISSKQPIRSKTKTQSRIRQGTSTIQARKHVVRNVSKMANSASRTMRAGHIDTSNGKRTPVYDLPETSRNNPRDPNGHVDGNDYRPPVIEEQPAPLPDGVNTGLLSRWKGDPREDAGNWPDPEPSGNQRRGGFSRWVPGETQPNGTPLWEDDATRERWSDNPPPSDIDSDEAFDEFIEWLDKYDGGDNTITYGPTLTPGNGSIPSDDGIVTAEEMDKIEQEADANTSEDPEPEGDDPDEMRGQMASEQRVITGGARTGQGPINPVQPSSNHGKRKPGEWLPGESITEHGRRVTSGTPLPEDGGPDESTGAGSVQALDSKLANRGMAAYPTPDAGQGGGPINPGPNAVQGQLNLSNFGIAASPAPEAGGGGTVPPRPEM
jgi:hypothetical protein